MEVSIPFGTKKETLQGLCEIPPEAKGIVLFAHGSGSSRMSLRNRRVAEALQNKGIATLLFDLLTADEEIVDNVTAELRFNIPLLTDRLIDATRWTMKEHSTLAIGYFGASTGAAAALAAAAQLGSVIRAIVSRGGRPDLADKALAKVVSPTLLIVGSRDSTVISLNKIAYDALGCTKKLHIIHGATHLFEEPGKMEEVTQAALTWFQTHLIQE
jgi:pimeloyl-ACP methyl ester carboxylesterase